ncbi:MAG: sugar ABC transporter substrate-binding protein [Rhizobiaceae bacterium]
MTIKKKLLQLGFAMVLSQAIPNSVQAERFDDGLAPEYYAVFKGKKIAFVPLSMGFDLTQGWNAAMQRSAKELGYEIIIRDSNWSVEAGAQAIEQLIIEKPDILIFHNNDMQAYSKLITRAMREGINVIQMNLKTLVNSDAYVGGDWYQVGMDEIAAAGKLCGAGTGTSGKIAILQGPPTSPPSQLGVQGMQDALKARGDMEVVSLQAADWDASKARNITATILKQHPDLCAVVGLWDNQDIGAVAAIREANLTGKVHVVTEGGGNRKSGCTNIESGAFSAYVKVDTRQQASELVDVIKYLLQAKPKPGSMPIGYYTQNVTLTKDVLTPRSCWTVDEIAAGNK